MNFIIEKEVIENFPGAVIGVLIVKNINNSSANTDISSLLRAEEKRIKEVYQPATLSQDPKIDCWRKAYSTFGVKSKDAKSSVENLYKMVSRGIEMRNINKLVDLYNYICLKYMIPVGGEDLDEISGDLQLSIAGDNEKAVNILGSDLPESPSPGEVFYKDDKGAVCRRWNWREADRTKLTKNTQNAILVLEGLPPTTAHDIETALEELRSLVDKYCGGEFSTHILNKDNPKITI